ncbi:MAG TPA: hypothetical protein VMA36_03645 [Candidatus Limnocylindria bacterium]|jgi:hypothetical protein|nr:hypothetical protein [Candidatus Limnocylindria bacterium]
MRLGKFHQQLVDWAERSCVLTVTFASTGGEIRFAGVLRPYYSLHSLRGWALVPPQQHGGFESLRLTALNLEAATTRLVLGAGSERRLRFASDGERVFQLERDQVVFTGPPRTTGGGRYLYVGGRRRPAPEPWMLG